MAGRDKTSLNRLGWALGPPGLLGPSQEPPRRAGGGLGPWGRTGPMEMEGWSQHGGASSVGMQGTGRLPPVLPQEICLAVALASREPHPPALLPDVGVLAPKPAPLMPLTELQCPRWPVPTCPRPIDQPTVQASEMGMNRARAPRASVLGSWATGEVHGWRDRPQGRDGEGSVSG